MLRLFAFFTTLAGLRCGIGALALGLALAATPPAMAQEAPPRWNQLSPGERQSLAPLEAQWAAIDAVRKEKWREIAQRYPHLPVEQQNRIRARMVEWAKMSASERNAARLRYQAAKRLPASEREARWGQYQSLSDDQRRALAGRAELRMQASPTGRTERPTGVDLVQRKSNIVPAPPKVTQNKPVAPGTVQAGVGATTRPITQRPAPPKHQQAGQPKIAATPEFVDRATLLPQRGPQAALVEPQRASQ